jgi:hypothetical protein
MPAPRAACPLGCDVAQRTEPAHPGLQGRFTLAGRCNFSVPRIAPLTCRAAAMPPQADKTVMGPLGRLS